MKIATWNVNSLKVRLPHVLAWLSENPIDILCLQELKQDQASFPLEAIQAQGYQAIWLGQKTYNGVAILVKDGHSITDVIENLPSYPDEQKRVLTATIAGLRVICAYFVNGESLESPKYAYKLTWLEHMETHVKTESLAHEKLVLLGDFNIAPDDRDVPNPDDWLDKTLCSAPERAAFFRLIELGLSDSFRLFHQDSKLYTWWDYRMMNFRRNNGLRIDHILISAALKPLALACEIDKVPRKWERPSDHAPVILTLQ
jgi:exodeoxyribonuclease-3